MPIPFLAIAGASAGLGLINSFLRPKNPFNEEYVNRLIDLQMNRTLTEGAISTRRQLAASGVGGSTVVNAILQDQAARIRSQYDEERARLLGQAQQAQFQDKLATNQQRGQIFGDIAGLAFAGYRATQPNPFAGYLDQLRGIYQNQNLPQGIGAGFDFSQDVPQNYFDYNPNQSQSRYIG